MMAKMAKAHCINDTSIRRIESGLMHDKSLHDTSRSVCRSRVVEILDISASVLRSWLACVVVSRQRRIAAATDPSDGVRLLCWLPSRAGHRLVEVSSTAYTINGARYVRP